MLDYFIFTDKGDRAVNEDSVGCCENNLGKFFILCDGLGGHGKGDEASSLVVTFIKDYADKANSDNTEAFIDGAIIGAQNTLLNYQKENQITGQSKTTLSLLCVNNTDNTFSIAHIGDSRVYKFHRNKYVYRTLDHSVPQMLVLSGEIKEKHIRHHEDRNRLLRCMGIEWEGKRFEIDQINQPYETGDAFFMCSDGFWDWILEKDMEKALKKFPNATECGEYLVKKAMKRGMGKNMDNFSLIIVRE